MSETKLAVASGSARLPEWMDTPEKRRRLFALQVLATAFTGDTRHRREMMVRCYREDARCTQPMLKPCPWCRGYELESQWCDHCNRAGYVLSLNDRHEPRGEQAPN